MRTNILTFCVTVLTATLQPCLAVERYVSPVGGHVPPFINWANAATNIQAAIDAASAGDTVWVTNGVYATGGKVMDGNLTNRIAIDKAITVQSVNGAQVTIVEGIWPPLSTNGPVGVRCAWLTDGARLRGFTLRGGSTRQNPFSSAQGAGGGVLGSSTAATIADCVIVTNICYLFGGGAYQVTATNCLIGGNRSIGPSGAGVGTGTGGGVRNCVLKNCQVVANYAETEGGGAAYSFLDNCLLFGNSSLAGGSAVMAGTLKNCTVTGNISRNSGSAVSNGAITNSIIWENAIQYSATNPSPNYVNSTLSHCCTTPLPPGVGNLAADPQLVDEFHLAATSPCRDTGNPQYVLGTDLDGEPWLNPPSMGADQFTNEGLSGPLQVSIETQPTVMVNRWLSLIGHVSGRASRIEWHFGDGPTITNLSYATKHFWSQPGNYLVTFRAFNDDYPLGVTTNATVEVLPIAAPRWTSIQKSFTWYDLDFNTEVGVSNTIEFATNLAAAIDWMPLSNVVSTNNTMHFRDTGATNEARFYRIRAQ